MDNDILKEYLVKIGIDIPMEEIQKFNRHMETFDKGVFGLVKRINNLFSGWKAVGLAYAEAARRIFNFTAGIAKANIETQKFAKRMFLTNDSAKVLSRTLEAMDLQFNDLQDVALNPELFSQYRELIRLGKELTGNDEIDESLRKVREVSFEFTKLKLIFTYLGERIAYYVSKVFESPTGKEFINAIKTFGSFLRNNIDDIARKIASFLGIILRTAMRVSQIIRGWWELLKTSYNWLESKLNGLGKIITGIIATVGVALLLSPIGKLLLILQGVMLLIDDYMGYKEGSIYALPWEKLEDLQKFLSEYWTNVLEVLGAISDLWDTVFSFLKEYWDNLVFVINSIGETFSKWWSLITDGWNTMIDFFKFTWKRLIKDLKDTWDLVIDKLEKLWASVKEFFTGGDVTPEEKEKGVKYKPGWLESTFQLPLLGLGRLVLPKKDLDMMQNREPNKWLELFRPNKTSLNVTFNGKTFTQEDIQKGFENAGLVINRTNRGGNV